MSSEAVLPGPVEPGPVEPGPMEPGPMDPGPMEPGPMEPGPPFEIARIVGNPTPEEEAALLAALEGFLAPDPVARPAGASLSAWTLAGRLAGRRGGILDALPSLGPAAWAASARIPWSGRAHQGRTGRGESR